MGTNKPCNVCGACISFNGENNPDIVIIDEQEKSIKTETIREVVKGVYEKPIKSAKKVYIINDCEKMTKEAQNSLLKTLEEPPEYVVIILITKNENLLLNTIKSRCTKIQFERLTDEELKKVLTEKLGITDVSKNMLEIAEGSLEKAVLVQGKEEIFEEIKQTFTKIKTFSIIDLLNKKDIIFKNKEDIQEILDYINIVLLNKSKEDIDYLKGIEIVEETKDRLTKNSNYDMTIDNLLLKLWEEMNG